MRYLVYLIISFIFLSGCSQYGAHQHYIISHDEVEPEPVR
jgi:hypothetical protein